MGGTCGSILKNKKGNFSIPQLQSKNQYEGKIHSLSQDEQKQIQKIMENIAPKCQGQSLKKVAAFIKKEKNHLFIDDKFFALEESTQARNKNSLSNLYNFQRLNMNHTYKQERTNKNQLKQNQVQFCYLTTVFYLYCQYPSLKENLLKTITINEHHCYILRLFCNGRQTETVVDDVIPLDGENLKYLNIGKGKEIWPILLEKAWCKQLGGYTFSKGLSPEDAFEEITGIPAYSYSLQNQEHIANIVQDAVKMNFWVAFTANISNEKDFKSRQVFYLDSSENNHFYLRSPFYDSKTQHLYDENLVKMGINQIVSYFQFVTIGYYLPDYSLRSFPVKSRKRQDSLYWFEVENQEKINIRFIQLYSQYLDLNNAEGYDYSPVFMELYDHEHKLVEEGCQRSVEGNRSSNITHNLFVSLSPGKYYLRVEVDWLNQKALNEGTICVYSSQKIQIKEVQRNLQEELLEALIFDQFKAESNYLEVTNSQQQLKIKSIQKKHRYTFQIENTSKKQSELKIWFKESENIRTKLYGSQKEDGWLMMKMKLEGEKSRIFEMLAEDPRLPLAIKPFEVQKK